MKRIVGLFLVVGTACTIPQTSETSEANADSVAVLSPDTLVMSSGDTVYRPLNLIGKFSKPQIDPTVAFAYENIDLYETTDTSNVIGQVPFKAKMKLKGAEKAGLIEVEYDGKVGFVFSDLILPFPVPETEDEVEYFTSVLMLIKDPIERRSTPEHENDDGFFSFTEYHFEGDIKIETGRQYEYGFVTVKIPGLSLAQAFHLGSYFYKSFNETFESFPLTARDEELSDSEQTHIIVQVTDRVLSISVSKGEGCSWQDSVSLSEDLKGVVMETGGGC